MQAEPLRIVSKVARILEELRVPYLIHLPTMYKVDVFIPRLDALSREEMARRQVLAVQAQGEEFILPFCTAEDTIVQKLLWYCEGGEVLDRQWQDLLGILRIRKKTLEYEYLHRWAAAKSLSALLERAIEGASRDDGTA
jgi:hypothetical protein